MAICEINWAPVPAAEWAAKFKTIPRSTLLQHAAYAQADRDVNQMGLRRGIIHIDGQEAGLLQLGEVGLVRNLVHVVNLDRGPLWFEGCGTLEAQAAFFRTFGREQPRRFGRKRRVLPELEDTGPGRALLEEAGFARADKFQGYETIWVDLRPEEERLRAKLDGNWRRFLSKSERERFEVREDWLADGAEDFLRTYEADRAAKSYSGPSRRMLDALIRYMVPRGEAVILTAERDGEAAMAGMLILLHGSSATYQVGVEPGRGAEGVGASQAFLACDGDAARPRDHGLRSRWRQRRKCAGDQALQGGAWWALPEARGLLPLRSGLP